MSDESVAAAAATAGARTVAELQMMFNDCNSLGTNSLALSSSQSFQ
jgi:hypothetical protein